jgi:hypothetical protein
MDIEKISLEKVTEQQIKEIKYGDFKKLSEKLGVEMEKTFGVKKAVLAKDLWRAVCAKREQLEAGMSEEDIAKDNLARKQKREKNILDAKMLEELEKERAKNVVLEKQEKKPITKEQAEQYIKKIEDSLMYKKKTPGQKKNSLMKLRKFKLILEAINKEEEK